MPAFDMKPVDVPQEVLDGLKSIPTVTVYAGVCNFGSRLNVCEGLTRLTPRPEAVRRAGADAQVPPRAARSGERENRRRG